MHLPSYFDHHNGLYACICISLFQTQSKGVYMTLDAKKRILFISRIVISILLAISAVCFIVGASVIYFSTDRNPYTYESIATTFGYICVPVFLTVIAVIAGGVLHLVVGENEETVKGFREKAALVAATERRLNLSEIDGKYSSGISREKKIRRIHFIFNLVLYAVAVIISLVYSLIPSNFTGDYNASVISLTYILLAAFCIPVAVTVARMILDSRSLERELSLAKAGILAMKEQGVAFLDGKETEKSILADFLKLKEKQITLYTRVGITTAAVALIFIGVFGGGMADVLAKAIKICTECIGLG